MGVFAVAALAGFLLFGWIKASPGARDFFKKPCVQAWLGLLALVVVAFSVVVQIFQWAECWIYLCSDFQYWVFPYWVFLIVQHLTGPEAMQFILGVAFGCILRHWGPHFWEMRMRPGTRYNWVAISLVGLLLLAAASPYIGSLLRDWGVTGLKTPVVEFHFAGRTTARVDDLSLREQFSRNFNSDASHQSGQASRKPNEAPPSSTPYFYILPDIDYLTLFPNNKSEERKENYKRSVLFGKGILDPLNSCARQAYNNYLDIESIRHALSPVAQQLRLLIQAGQSQNSISATKLRNNLLTKIKENVNRLREAFVPDKSLFLQAVEQIEQSVYRLKEALAQDKDLPLQAVEQIEQSVYRLREAFVPDKSLPLQAVEQIEQSVYRLREAFVPDKSLPLQAVEQIEQSVYRLKNMCPLGNLDSIPAPEVLADAPHIYLALALLDEYNDNREGGISILKSALMRFGNDRDLGPWILFNINYTLGIFLDDLDHDPESIFPYLDDALEIAQDTLGKIDKQKQIAILQNKLHIEDEPLYSVEKLFEFAKILAKNALAYISAQKEVRQFKALQYAEQNYDVLEKLTGLMKPRIIDTYGYVKMAFAVRKIPPNFDEIKRAKALFEEALSHIKRVQEQDRDTKAVKRYGIKIIRSHLEQANRLLENR